MSTSFPYLAPDSHLRVIFGCANFQRVNFDSAR